MKIFLKNKKISFLTFFLYCRQPGSGGYLPTQPDAASGVRRGGVAAPSPPSSMLRPGAGYPQVTLPPAAMARYGLPGAVPPTNFPASAAAAAAAYTRQTAAAAAAVQVYIFFY